MVWNQEQTVRKVQDISKGVDMVGNNAYYGFLIQASVTEIQWKTTFPFFEFIFEIGMVNQGGCAFHGFFIGAFVSELCPVEVYRNLFCDLLQYLGLPTTTTTSGQVRLANLGKYQGTRAYQCQVRLS